jgi:membrane-associated phospholipid phosphatase
VNIEGSGGTSPPDPLSTVWRGGTTVRDTAKGAMRPVDRLLAMYNVVLAGVWALVVGQAWYVPWVLGAHVAAVALPWLLARADARLSRGGRVLREIYPLLWISGFWGELDAVRRLLHSNANDAAAIALDLAVFGEHLSETWIRAMPELWFSELMHGAYFAYYAAVFLPPLVMGLVGRQHVMRVMTFRLTVTYLACYLVYIAFPVDGPMHTLGRASGPFSEGVLYGLVHRTQSLGDSLGAAFPSSHVAGAVTSAILAWRWLGRGVAALLTVEAIGVCLSTVYTQHHYAIDSLAGIVWALWLQLVVAPWLSRVLGGERADAPGMSPGLPEREAARASA